ncbi:MAG: phosphoribosyltransferase family protein [Bacillota bacterium]|nr:phosphoribosyltransferase family protein [Bacillota bacterium]
MVFSDRKEAGRLLAEKLLKFKDKNSLILGIPRGGVIVAAEVAAALEAPLDVIIPRKIGAPFNQELAVGAVAPDGTVLYDEAMMRYLGLDESILRKQISRQLDEIERRLQLYRGEREPLALEGRTVIVIDDGIATGFTVQAALRSLRRQKLTWLVLAVPVAPWEAVVRLKPEVDELICLLNPEVFYAVGQFYKDFRQTTDEEVIAALAHNYSRPETE